MNAGPNSRFWIFGSGVFVFDADVPFLYRDHDPVENTETLPLLVLRALIEAGGLVVSKEDLQDAVWGRGSNVYESSLSVAISKLRRIVHPVEVNNVHGRGYRLNAPDLHASRVQPRLTLKPVFSDQADAGKEVPNKYMGGSSPSTIPVRS